MSAASRAVRVPRARLEAKLIEMTAREHPTWSLWRVRAQARLITAPCRPSRGDRSAARGGFFAALIIPGVPPL